MESDDRALWDCLVALRERWITPNQFMEIIHGIDALCSFFALMTFPDTAEVGEVGIHGVSTPAPVAQSVPDALDEHEYQDVWNSAFAAGWNDCRKKMLAAGQAQEGKV